MYYSNTPRLYESNTPRLYESNDNINKSKILSQIDIKNTFKVTEESSITTTIPSTEYTNSRPTTATSLDTTISTISNNLSSPNLEKDLFTPTTYTALNEEIRRNSKNISDIDKNFTGDELKESILNNLNDERRYLLDQKSKHLEATLQLAKNKDLGVDSDVLHKQISDLKEKTDSLYSKSLYIESRLDKTSERK